MSRRVDLHVFAVPQNDPDGLLSVWASSDRPAARASFPLVADPPPDTLFMRATGLDLSVFGENVDEGELQMIDHESLKGWSLEHLITAVERDAEQTAHTLYSYAVEREVACREAAMLDALRTGAWPTAPDAMHQAAAFARRLLGAGRDAVPAGQSVVWAYVGGRVSYEYP
jgi:hypothetical protein